MVKFCEFLEKEVLPCFLQFLDSAILGGNQQLL